MSRNVEPLWSLSVSLLQSCLLHRVSPHLFRLNSCLHLPGADFLEGQWWAQQVGRDVCLLLGSLWDVARIQNHCHFIIYRHVCIVSGDQLPSGVWLFAILWTVACQAPLSMEFSRQNTGVSCCFLFQGIFLISSRVSSWPRDWTLISSIGRQILYCWATGETQFIDTIT